MLDTASRVQDLIFVKLRWRSEPFTSTASAVCHAWSVAQLSKLSLLWHYRQNYFKEKPPAEQPSIENPANPATSASLTPTI
jgi:hypothetical protein